MGKHLKSINSFTEFASNAAKDARRGSGEAE